MLDDELLVLAPDEDEPEEGAHCWKIMVVDDEEEVHGVTHLALEDFEFSGRKLEFIDAFSGAEAKKMLHEHDDIALILLDVVMETDHAGLDVVQYIRETLKNPFVRIILRTGQPGQAPEYKIITGYDINDYKEKTELTRQKLFTAVYTGLSSYRDLVALEGNRVGLEKVIESSACIFETRSIEDFAEGVLQQLTSLLYLEKDAMVVMASGIAAEKANGHIDVVAATGRYSESKGMTLRRELDPEAYDRIVQGMQSASNDYGSNYFVGYYKTESGVEHALYVAADHELTIPDMKLIELFSRNVAIAHENVRLFSEQKQQRGPDEH